MDHLSYQSEYDLLPSDDDLQLQGTLEFREDLHRPPEAVQVTKLNEEDNVVFNCDEIVKIFGDAEVKNSPICIYSIAGPCRIGKSFLMTVMLQYLQHKSQDKEGNWRDGKQSIIDKGFEWKSGVDPVTRGIYIWSQPFWLEFKPNKRVAVFLMDTEGLFDNTAVDHHNELLFTLSTYISSCQIYNMKSNIHTHDMQKLQMFSKFAEKLFSESERKTPQSLIFLLRDWENISYDCGFTGGNEYLKNHIETASDDHEGLYVDIINAFEKVECALLPHPGLDFVEYKGDDASVQLSKIRDKFWNTCDEVCQTIFQNLVVKQMDEEQLTGNDIVNQTRVISSLIEKKTFGIHVLWADQLNKTYQTEEALKEPHRIAVENAMKHFDQKRKIGNEDDIRRYRNALYYSLQGRFFMFQSYNGLLEVNVKHEQWKMFQKCLDFIMESFAADVTVMNEDELRQFARDKTKQALAMFKRPALQRNHLEVEIWSNYRTQLKEIIDAETKIYLLKNDLNQTKLDIILRNKICEALKSLMTAAKKKARNITDIQKLIRSTAQAARAKIDKVKPTLPIAGTKKQELEQDLREIENIYHTRFSIEEEISSGDVYPLTFAKIQDIIASHGKPSAENMPQSQIDQVLGQFTEDKLSSLRSTIVDMCTNEWNLQRFKWKIEKKYERVAVLKAQVLAIEGIISKRKTLLEGTQNAESARRSFQQNMESISDQPFIEHRRINLEQMLQTLQDTWIIEQSLYESRISESLNRFQKQTVWNCCHEMNENLDGVSANERFMNKIQDKIKSEYKSECRKIAQNDAQKNESCKSFETAINDLMVHWKKVNLFHKEVFTRMTGWAEFVRSFKRFTTYRIINKIPGDMRDPADFVLLVFRFWKVKNLALTYNK